MFMKDDKKQKMASMIVSNIKKPEASNPESEEQSSYTENPSEPEADQYDVAADEVFEAIANKDKSALKESLKSMIQMCMNEDDEEPSESND